MRKAAVIGAILAAAVATPAAASPCNGAAMVLSCFHPTAVYNGCEAYDPWRATIYFAGGFTGRRYAMDILRELRPGGWMRYRVLQDSAITAPNPNCPLEHWQPARRVSLEPWPY